MRSNAERRFDLDDAWFSDPTSQSSFPLHAGIARHVEETQADHGWQVAYNEHLWTDDFDDRELCLDLVLRDAAGTNVLAVTCKRDAESTWSFPIPKTNARPDAIASAWISHFQSGSFVFPGWAQLAFLPLSLTSEFCVVPGQGGKPRPTLERMAAELVSGTRALAVEERRQQPKAEAAVGIYLSAIVTTAKLVVCKHGPIDPVPGARMLLESEFEEVPYVRFRKELSTRALDGSLDGDDPFRALALIKEHTVFVINAGHFCGFLKDFRMDRQILDRVLNLTRADERSHPSGQAE